MSVRELAWTPDAGGAGVRVPRFVRRSMVALQDVAAAANAIAANLESCFESQIATSVVPPVELGVGEWEHLSEGRRCYRVCGEIRDAVLLVDDAMARRIIAAAFAEETAEDSLSRFESRVLDRCMAQIAAGLHALCGDTRATTDGAPYAPSVYFELRLGAPADATLGIALGAAKHPAERAFLHAELLEECPVECWVRLGAGNVDIFTLAGLAMGDVVRLETKVGAFATLNLAAQAIATGEGGIFGDRTAFKVHELI